MKTFIITSLTVFLLAGTFSNSYGDLSRGGYESPIRCTQVDCDKAYTLHIKRVNPRITNNEIKNILDAVNKNAPKYFGTGVDLEVGKEMTLAIVAVEDGFKTGSSDNIESKMVRLKSLLTRYDNDWKAAILAYDMGHEAVDRLIEKKRIRNYGGFWDKVWGKKYDIHWKKGTVYRNKEKK